MKLKQIDKVFDYCLWGVFALAVIFSYLKKDAFSAPKFEIANTEYTLPYQYETEDGERINSCYYLAWKHDGFAFSPDVVAYDPSNGKWSEFKDEYIDENKAKMSESKYSFWQRIGWVYFGIYVILSALIVYFVGGWIRDFILYNIVKKRNTFADASYYLYENRRGFTSEVKKILISHIDEFIAVKQKELSAIYQPNFVHLIGQILTTIKETGDTRVKFYYSYFNNVEPQQEFLKKLAIYWESQIGKEPDAEKTRDAVNELRQRSYTDIKIKTDASDCAPIVTSELKKLFTKILGGEVFNFEAYQSAYATASHKPGHIFVTTTIRNTVSRFTWSGTEVSGKSIPGLTITFQIYHYVKGQKIILWNRVLSPVCTYKAENLDLADLYENMITETIKSFPDSFKN